MNDNRGHSNELGCAYLSTAWIKMQMMKTNNKQVRSYTLCSITFMIASINWHGDYRKINVNKSMCSNTEWINIIYLPHMDN